MAGSHTTGGGQISRMAGNGLEWFLSSFISPRVGKCFFSQVDGHGRLRGTFVIRYIVAYFIRVFLA